MCIISEWLWSTSALGPPLVTVIGHMYAKGNEAKGVPGCQRRLRRHSHMHLWAALICARCPLSAWRKTSPDNPEDTVCRWRASLAQRFPASSVLARAGAGCGSAGDVTGAWLAKGLQHMHTSVILRSEDKKRRKKGRRKKSSMKCRVSQKATQDSKKLSENTRYLLQGGSLRSYHGMKKWVRSSYIKNSILLDKFIVLYRTSQSQEVNEWMSEWSNQAMN